MNIFERASRNGLRFQSPVGLLTTEQLWSLPLTAKTSTVASLNGIGIAIKRKLAEVSDESLVEARPNPQKAELELALEIVKHVIAAKQAQAAAADERAAKAQRRGKILEALAAQEDKELTSKSKDDLLKELQALDAA
ncbi:hypothetical protein [EBPR siphovirus 2]|nr:hypothetical protein [EBPR siphovirus 2]